MKFDHLVLNVDKKYQIESEETRKILEMDLLYHYKKGKSTNGFKATNIWIGKEYLEMIQILQNHGGGWKKEWVDKYLSGHRGLICIMLEVKDLNSLIENLRHKGISISEPEKITVRFLFGLIKKSMPWSNSYLDFFDYVPLQIGFQQMDNEKIRQSLEKHMIPNSTDNNISGIKIVHVYGPFTTKDFQLLQLIFENVTVTNKQLRILLDGDQELIVEVSNIYNVEVKLNHEKQSSIIQKAWIENTMITIND